MNNIEFRIFLCNAQNIEHYYIYIWIRINKFNGIPFGDARTAFEDFLPIHRIFLNEADVFGHRP